MTTQIPDAVRLNIEKMCENGNMLDRLGEIVFAKYAKSMRYTHNTIDLINVIIDIMGKDVNPKDVRDWVINNRRPVVTATLPHPTPTPPMLQPVVQASPHSPVKRKAKLPYWIKVVTSYDEKTKNGYGLKGKFIYPQDTSNLPTGTILVMQITDFKTKDRVVYTLQTSASSSINMPLPNGAGSVVLSKVVLLASDTDFDSLYRRLKGLAVPMTQ